jgi:hypothetical protein
MLYVPLVTVFSFVSRSPLFGTCADERTLLPSLTNSKVQLQGKIHYSGPFQRCAPSVKQGPMNFR